MKHNQNIPHEVPKKQPNADQKNQLPPTDRNPSDVPLKEPIANENEEKEKKENKGFTQNERSHRTRRPIAGDKTSRLL